MKARKRVAVQLLDATTASQAMVRSVERAHLFEWIDSTLSPHICAGTIVFAKVPVGSHIPTEELPR